MLVQLRNCSIHGRSIALMQKRFQSIWAKPQSNLIQVLLRMHLYNLVIRAWFIVTVTPSTQAERSLTPLALRLYGMAPAISLLLL